MIDEDQKRIYAIPSHPRWQTPAREIEVARSKDTKSDSVECQPYF